MKYRAIIPFIHDMGSVSPIMVSDKPSESGRAETLWHLNRMRDHDGLPHLNRLPDGVEFEPIYSPIELVRMREINEALHHTQPSEGSEK